MNYVFVRTPMNKFHRRHEVRVSANKDRRVKLVINRRFNQVRGQCRVYPFLNSALKRTLTVRASPNGFPTLLVLAGKAPAWFSLLDGDVISGKPFHHIEESAKSGVSGTLRVK